MRLKDRWKELQQTKDALLATNFYNFETLQGIIKAASISKRPIILQLTRSSIEYMGLPVAKSIAESALSYHNVEGWIHLDHGDSYELAASCLDAGFDSVMIDASEKSFSENVKISKAVVKLAEKYGASVEAELGYVAKLGQNTGKTGFTEPEEAKLFIEETGIDALAIAIGTAHGFYKEEPKLDLDRLVAIREMTNAALVLHGASGISNNVLYEAVQKGISKINLATEIKNIFMKTLKGLVAGNNEIDLRKVFPPAISSVTSLVLNKLEVIQHKVS
ncbi:MAG: class II fructose-bisphosphate aldolase family protein [Chitinophagaceae bacterium]|nr:class II fructose-bisphosphate aldolase family protein [Chitinophagaceae bacterium]